MTELCTHITYMSSALLSFLCNQNERQNRTQTHTIIWDVFIYYSSSLSRIGYTRKSMWWNLCISATAAVIYVFGLTVCVCVRVLRIWLELRKSYVRHVTHSTIFIIVLRLSSHQMIFTIQRKPNNNAVLCELSEICRVHQLFVQNAMDPLLLSQSDHSDSFK